ncbi:thioredoxin domain-containing protein [Candidatus Gottesmanbacteria bacterium]|nr:thioredoxin domain-containing protein [Candidatus Gottesmanbacteria bacterium]
MNKLIYVLVGLLVVASFVIGSLWTKVSYLEKGNISNGQVAGQQAGGAGAQPAGKYASFDAALSDYAKQASLDGGKFSSCVAKAEKKAVVDADLKQGEGLGVSGTPGFFVNGKFLGGAYPFESFKEIIDKELSGTGSTDYKDYSQALQQAYEQGGSFNPEPKDVEVGKASIRGGKNAKVTIVEFSDFQCPFCARAYPTMNQVLDGYGDKVKLVYKHFPLNAIHPLAQKAAEASECAKDQGKFWEFHDVLFEKAEEWTSLSS